MARARVGLVVHARSIVGTLALLSACAFANPLATPKDGTDANGRIRIGISAASFRGDCVDGDPCSVQLSLAHAGAGNRRIELTAVRVIAEGIDLGPLPIAAVGRWHRGAYRDARLDLGTFDTAKVSVAFAAIDWEHILHRHGITTDTPELTIEVDLSVDDTPMVVRSMFAVQREPERVFMIT